MNLDNHPTVIEIRRRNTSETTVRESAQLDADLLKRLCLEAGADDVGLVEIDRPELVPERVNIEAVFPHAKTLVSFVCRMNRDPILSPARSIANLEFHQTTDRVNEVAQRILAESVARELGPKGVHVAYVVIDAVIDLEWTRAMTSKPAEDPFFIQPSAIADEIWHVVHQDRSAWSFNVEVRPFQETW